MRGGPTGPHPHARGRLAERRCALRCDHREPAMAAAWSGSAIRVPRAATRTALSFPARRCSRSLPGSAVRPLPTTNIRDYTHDHGDVPRGSYGPPCSVRPVAIPRFRGLSAQGPGWRASGAIPHDAPLGGAQDRPFCGRGARNPVVSHRIASSGSRGPCGSPRSWVRRMVAAAARAPYVQALMSGDAGRIELERGETQAVVKRRLLEAARESGIRIRSSWESPRSLVWKRTGRA